MRVGCVICSDSFISFTDVSAIPCGHIFHTHCILQWIEKSKSCPTCRHKALCKQVQKLYFDVTSGSDTQVDPDSLQNQIDSLKFQVVEKTQTIRRINEENSTFKKQNKGLRDEVVSLEGIIKDQDLTVGAYRQQIRSLSSLEQKATKAVEEANSVKAELKLLKRIKDLVEGHSSDIEDTITCNTTGSNLTENIRTLSTMCIVLKSRLNKLMEEKRWCLEETNDVMSKLKDTTKHLHKAKEELECLRKGEEQMQRDLQSMERENIRLKQKVVKLQEAITSPSGDVKNSAIRRLIAESPAPLELKNPNLEEDIVDCTPEIMRKSRRISPTSEESSTSKDSSAKPVSQSSSYLQVKCASIAALKRPTLAERFPSSTANNIFKDGRRNMFIPSIASKRKIMNNPPIYPGDDAGYDGMGGHHKVDYFPNPNSPKLINPQKKKPQKSTKIVINKGSTRIPSKSISDFFKYPFNDESLQFVID